MARSSRDQESIRHRGSIKVRHPPALAHRGKKEGPRPRPPQRKIKLLIRVISVNQLMISRESRNYNFNLFLKLFILYMIYI